MQKYRQTVTYIEPFDHSFDAVGLKKCSEGGQIARAPKHCDGHGLVQSRHGMRGQTTASTACSLRTAAFRARFGLFADFLPGD